MDKYKEKAEAMTTILGGRTFSSEAEAHKFSVDMMEAALREAAAESIRRVNNEGNCRREHGGSWADFEKWMEKEAAALDKSEGGI